MKALATGAVSATLMFLVGFFIDGLLLAIGLMLCSLVVTVFAILQASWDEQITDAERGRANGRSSR